MGINAMVNKGNSVYSTISYYRDFSTELLFHSSNVARLTLDIGRSMSLSVAELDDLAFLGLMHDVGKSKTPDDILYKRTKLNPEEWNVMKLHPIYSEEIIVNSKGLCINEDKVKEYGVVIRGHHEKFGGGGYPDNIKGEEIHFKSRIITIADIYDAISSPRVYRPYSLVNPTKVLAEEVGKTIDPYIFKHALKVLKNY